MLAVAVAAALVLAIGLAAAGAFSGGSHPRQSRTVRPSANVSSTRYGDVAWVTAKTLSQSVHPRVANTWGEIKAREFVLGAFQQYGYFVRTQEFIAGKGSKRMHSANLIATKQGDSARQLIVGAHYDSVNIGQGYLDNASGIGLLLETAARLKPRSTPYTIVFVAFGAEEPGELGSNYYVNTMSKLEKTATMGMIDLDAVAGGDELTVTSTARGPTWLRDDALTAAQNAGVVLRTSPPGKGRRAGVSSAVSDDAPFGWAHIPTAQFMAASWAGGRDGLSATATKGRIWHTSHDSVSYVEKAFPGRTRRQLHGLARVLVTLLTAKLEKHR
jgi:alkaline phosphatase isozyme conversion protein